MPYSLSNFHRWDVTQEEAVAIQLSLAARVSLTPDLGEVRYIAGVDNSATGVARCAVVVLSYPELETVEIARAEKPLVFPYVPGLLSFREGPAILAAFDKLKQKPDLAFFDGQGISHPRRIGIASHIGVLLDLPTLGVGKSPFFVHGPQPGPEPGDWEPWKDRKGDTLAIALRSKRNTKPLFISPGHRIDLDTSLKYVLSALKGYRLPEPTRQAHNAAAIDDKQ